LSDLLKLDRWTEHMNINRFVDLENEKCTHSVDLHCLSVKI